MPPHALRPTCTASCPIPPPDGANAAPLRAPIKQPWNDSVGAPYSCRRPTMAWRRCHPRALSLHRRRSHIRQAMVVLPIALTRMCYLSVGFDSFHPLGSLWIIAALNNKTSNTTSILKMKIIIGSNKHIKPPMYQYINWDKLLFHCHLLQFCFLHIHIRLYRLKVLRYKFRCRFQLLPVPALTIPYRQTKPQGDGDEASVQDPFDPELTHITHSYVVPFAFYTAICM
jgi:hypothetical protein